MKNWYLPGREIQIRIGRVAVQVPRLTIEGGHREGKESWLTVLNDLKNRGLVKAPKLAVGDGALGVWGGLTEVYSKTRRKCSHLINLK